MSLFLTKDERDGIVKPAHPVVADYRWALHRRAAGRAANPGLITHDTTTEWWYVACEYVCDAAMAHAIKPDPQIATWLRGVVLDLARRSADDWIGPWFRDHASQPPVGHLETAHLSWACTLALDLAPEVFSDGEREEIRAVLRERAMPMCQRWIDKHHHLANWRCILLAGVTLPAALLGDRTVLERCAAEWKRTVECFQPDGTYGESLQYSHYAMYGLMLSWEALHRADPALAADLPIERYARGMRWHAASLLHRKPFGGAWGGDERPRALNFNDSAAHFAPSPEFLLHVALRCRERLPLESGLARWIHDSFWTPVNDIGPHDRATFGLLTDWTGLVLPFLGRLAAAAAPVSPAQAGLDTLQVFSNGDSIARDAWGGATVLGVHGGGDPLHGHGHLHADLNSFILVHNRERLLADPGHSCYRNLLHKVECGTASHSTCTFTDPAGKSPIEQSAKVPPRLLTDGVPGPTIVRGPTRLIAQRDGALTVIGSEAAAVYGAPLRRFARFWLLGGTHVLFVVDHIVSDVPIRTDWSWVLNNRNNVLDLNDLGDRIVARRGTAGMKLFHCAGGRRGHDAHGWLHEAYHPLPGQLGEGVNGSARILHWHEKEAATERWAVHAIAVDGLGAIAGWHLKAQEGQDAVLEEQGGGERWALHIDRTAGRIDVSEQKSGRAWRLLTGGTCRLDSAR